MGRHSAEADDHEFEIHPLTYECEHDVDRPVYWHCDHCGEPVTRANPGKFGVCSAPAEAISQEIRRLHGEGKHREATEYGKQTPRPEWGVYHLNCPRLGAYDVEYECLIFDVAWRLMKLNYEIGRRGAVEFHTNWHRFQHDILKRSGAEAALTDPEIDRRPLDYRAMTW